jgi:hypothetical protein
MIIVIVEGGVVQGVVGTRKDELGKLIYVCNYDVDGALPRDTRWIQQTNGKEPGETKYRVKAFVRSWAVERCHPVPTRSFIRLSRKDRLSRNRT